MFDERITQVQHLAEASLLINRDFTRLFPLPLRGILASMDGVVDLSYYTDVGEFIELKVKGIEQILREGTELDFDAEHGWTRVDYYPEATSWAFTYAKDRWRIDYWVERAREYNDDITNEVVKLLKPVLLVYDDALLTKVEKPNNRFNVRLPQVPDDRARAILAVYVNNTQETSDWMEILF